MKWILLLILFIISVLIKDCYQEQNPSFQCYSIILLRDEFDNEPKPVTVFVTKNYIASNGDEIVEFSQVGDLNDKIKFTICNNEVFELNQQIKL